MCILAVLVSWLARLHLNRMAFASAPPIRCAAAGSALETSTFWRGRGGVTVLQTIRQLPHLLLLLTILFYSPSPRHCDALTPALRSPLNRTLYRSATTYATTVTLRSWASTRDPLFGSAPSVTPVRSCSLVRPCCAFLPGTSGCAEIRCGLPLGALVNTIQ